MTPSHSCSFCLKNESKCLIEEKLTWRKRNVTLVVLDTLAVDPGHNMDLYLQLRHASVALSNTFGKQQIDAPMVKLVFGDINSKGSGIMLDFIF